jgi:hypothetical protein
MSDRTRRKREPLMEKIDYPEFVRQVKKRMAQKRVWDETRRQRGDTR